MTPNLYAVEVSNFDPFGHTTTATASDWSTSSAGGATLRSVTTSFSVINGYIDQTNSVTVADGSGNTVAKTAFSFDGNGNLLSETDSTTAATWLTHSFTYNANGTVATATDGNNAVTTTTSGACNGIFPSKVQSAMAAVYATLNWDCNGGVPLSATDANNATTSITYSDPLWRPTQINYPDGGATRLSYTANSVETKRKIDASRWTDAETLLDSLGRPAATSSLNAAGTWDRVDTCYNAMGEASFRSYAYTVPSAGTAPNCGGTGDAYLFDALGRPTQVTHSDGSTFLTSYAGRAVETQDEGNGASPGVGRVTRILQSDGLGRLSAVCEVTAATINGSDGAPGACGLDIAATGFLTSYTRDALGDILTVTQGQQTRSYAFDWLSRLSSETNPENGVTAYTYDGNSNVLTRTRPAPNQTGPATVTTTYTWDALNRLNTVSYSDGTQPRHFEYDVNAGWSEPQTNIAGRLTDAWVSGSSPAAEIFSYDPMGRPIQDFQCTPANCGTSAFGQSYAYNLAGDQTSATRTPGYTLAFTFDQALRPTGVTSSLSDAQHPGALATSEQYNAVGELTSVALGNGVQESWHFDARGRLTSHAAGSLYNLSNLAYAPDGDVSSANDSVNGNWNYGYDSLNRLSSASDATVGYGYGYDRRGNRWQQALTAGSGPTFSSAFDLDNHMVASGYSFDAAGNVMSDANCNYSYDAENELVAVSRCASATYTYNAFGRRVRAVTPNYTIDLVLDQQGRIADEMGANGAQWWRGEIYAGGRQLATYANGITYFTHADWLGTVRARTDNTGALAESCTSLPYGDALSCGSTSPSPAHFTGQVRDFESGLDYFQARHYASSQARFVSPDPSGLAAVDPNNPQTWNRYAYVNGSPATLVDPLGMEAADPCTPGKDGVFNCPPVTVRACSWWEFWCWGGSGGAGGATAPDWGMGGPTFRQPDGGADGNGSSSGSSGPGNGPTVSHCLVVAAADKGASIALDIVGAIPAVGNAVCRPALE